MANLTISEGLALARAHMGQRTPTIGKHPTSGEVVNHTLAYRWDFPTGGSVNVSIGYDLRARGADRPALVPQARVTASLGAEAVQAIPFARCVEAIVLAAVETEVLMREHHYRPDEEHVAHAQSTDAYRDPYPTPACHATLAPGDYVVHPSADPALVTCGNPECQRAAADRASRPVRNEEPAPRATATECARPAGRRRT